MVLQDHFHPPLSTHRHWHAFHNAWATYISSELNERLPGGYFAEANVQFGIEIDVATFEDEEINARTEGLSWSPPAPGATVAVEFATESVEVMVFHERGGPTLAGAIELVSPANKDRAAHRQAFVSKCETYLHQGLGLVVVDVVTGRHANLHDELMERLALVPREPTAADLYAVSYRPVQRDEATELELWPARLTVRGSLPMLPLWLRGGLCMPIDLASSYARTCREQRVSA
jgi:hypothetical protein